MINSQVPHRITTSQQGLLFSQTGPYKMTSLDHIHYDEKIFTAEAHRTLGTK